VDDSAGPSMKFMNRSFFLFVLVQSALNAIDGSGGSVHDLNLSVIRPPEPSGPGQAAISRDSNTVRIHIHARHRWDRRLSRRNQRSIILPASSPTTSIVFWSFLFAILQRLTNRSAVRTMQVWVQRLLPDNSPRIVAALLGVTRAWMLEFETDPECNPFALLETSRGTRHSP